MFFIAEDFDYCWEDREENYYQDYDCQIFFDERDVAEEVAAEGEDRDPENAAENVVRNESRVVHFADAGDEGRECSNYWDESREDDCF